MIRTLASRLLHHPWQGLAALCAAQVLLWSLLPAATSLAPPLDVVEMLAWGEHWQFGYYKHPPLPAWIAEAARLMTGEPILGPMIAAQLCVALTFLFVFLLGRRLMGARDALLGTALCTGVYYFSWPTPELNHNVVQMPIWAASFWLFSIIRADPRRILPWAALGLVAGIGVYAKYSVAVLYLVLGIWILAEARLRRALLTPAPWIGLAIAVLVILPHLVWLIRTNFLPIAYAQARSAAVATSPWGAAGFLLTQLANHAPLLLPLAFAFMPWRRGAEQAEAETRRASASGHALRFLMATTLVPVFLTAVLAALTGSGLRDMWGAPMFTTSGLFAVALLRARLTDMAARRLLIGCGLLLLALPVIFALRVPVAAALHKKTPRNGWPMAEIAGAVTAAWRAETRRPLAIVGGDPWLAGLVSVGSIDRPDLAMTQDLAWSPWISPQEMADKGLVVVSFAGSAEPPLPGRTAKAEGDVEIPWSGPKSLVIHYAIYPPASSE